MIGRIYFMEFIKNYEGQRVINLITQQSQLSNSESGVKDNVI